MKLKLLLLLLGLTQLSFSQVSYFPPLSGNTWQNADFQDFKYDIDYTDSLYQYLDEKNSKGFIVLYDGKMVVEKYFDQFTLDSAWYWASAGKSLSAFLIGIAEENQLIDIGNPANQYLGNGWTTCSQQQEDAIKVWHLLSMSSGIDDSVADLDCTDPSCFKYKADPGTRWAYHNGVYHMSHAVIEASSGNTLNNFTATKLSSKTGISGLWLDHVFYSKPRSMARFGLLMLNKGIWNQDTLLKNREYIDSMTISSQRLNPAYGLLWWLNGTDTFMVPRVQLRIPGSLIPSAPSDMYAALGKNDQKIYVVPSQKLVIVRVGEDPGTGLLGPSSFDTDLWTRINRWRSVPTSVDMLQNETLKIYPNPNAGIFQVNGDAKLLRIINTQGKEIAWEPSSNGYKILTSVPGVYFAQFETENGTRLNTRFVMVR